MRALAYKCERIGAALVDPRFAQYPRKPRTSQAW